MPASTCRSTAALRLGLACASLTLAAPARADSGRIVYVGPGPFNTDIYSIAGDGTDQRRLTNDAAFDHFSWRDSGSAASPRRSEPTTGST